MREWMPASNGNAHSTNSCDRSTYGSPKRAALDLPSRWIGFYSSGTPEQLRDSTPRKHGCADDRLVCRQSRVMALLRLDGDVWSVIGGFVTYRLARKGGKETLERKFPARRLEKVYKIFRLWGFGAIAIAALLPPPAPMVPFLFAAGAMQYSVKKFLFALTLGRIIRYSLLAFLAVP